MPLTLARLIRQFVRRHAAAYAASGAMLAGIALITVWMPRHIGHMVDGLVAHQLSGTPFWRDIGWLLLAGVAIYGLRVAWRIRLYSAAYRMGVELREALHARLARQAPAFYQARRTGDLMALATNDIDAIEMAAGEALLAGFDGSLTFVLVVIAMAAGVDWRLACVALLPFPFMALAFRHISARVHQRSREALDRFGTLNDHVQETVTGLRTLRALGLERRNGERFAALAAAAAESSFESQRWEALYEPAVGTSLGAAMVGSLAFGGWLVWHDELTIGQLTSFGLYLGQLIWPMFAAGWVLSLIERGKAAWARLDPVLRAPLSVEDRGTRDTPPRGTLHFDGVTFAYPDAARAAVRDVSFALQPGRTLGIVGPTGAGKSTLLHLLLRHDVPQSGTIRFGDVPIEDYTLAALYSVLAWVPQEAFLFSATIAENIALARPDASRAEIEHAAWMADLDRDVVRFAEGFDTRVGERGVTLSGGQRQRVAIARALLSEAPILLLDDALSAVDTGTESRILAHLREERGRVDPHARETASLAAPRGSAVRASGRPSGAHRGAIIVSHRLSAVADADEIVVLRDGAVAERGNHDALIALDGWYAAQWRYQQIEESLAA